MENADSSIWGQLIAGLSPSARRQWSAMVDQAEQFLRGLGLMELRVRYHKGDLARIEVPTSALSKLADAATRQDLVATFRRLGFKYVTLDLEGFRSGSLNALVSLDQRRLFAPQIETNKP